MHDGAHGHSALLAVKVLRRSAPQCGPLRRIGCHAQEVVKLSHGVQARLYARRHLKVRRTRAVGT